MNRDLEEQLDEMGPEYRVVVARLRGATSSGGGSVSLPHGRQWLVAASLFVILGLGVFFQTSHPLTLSPSHPVIRGAHEYQMDVSEMIATQNPDGSWKNDFLTRRNAAALRVCDNPAARIAYKKALRYLSFKGLLPAKG